MSDSKTVFIVPGFKMKATGRSFAWLVKFLETKGVNVVKTPVTWNYKTLSQNTNEFVKFYNAHKTIENYVLGFSYGAVITLLTANILKPKMIYLCSLSPDFSEDIGSVDSKIIKYVGKKRFKDMRTRSGRIIAKKLSVPSVIFYGEIEGKKYPQLKKRCKETASLAKNSKLIIVKNSPHRINFPQYIEAIKSTLPF